MPIPISMGLSAGTYPLTLAKRRRREFVRRTWWRLSLIPLTVALVAFLGWWMWGDQQVSVWLMMPLFALAMLALVVREVDGTYHLEAAGQAEKWTSKELRRAVGRSRLADHIPFEGWDADHVVAMGDSLIVIETKYTDSVKDFSNRHRRDADGWANATYDKARTVRLLLKHQYGLEPAVQSLVVVWGMRAEGLPFMVDGVPIIHGRELRDYLAACVPGPRPIGPQLVSALRDFKRVRRRYEETRAKAP